MFFLWHLEGGLPSMLLFILEVLTGTGIGKGLSSELEGFDSFGVGSSRLSIWNYKNNNNMNQAIIFNYVDVN
jgi:hypothetical protein